MPNSDQVIKWAGITRRQLDNWVDKGYLKPVIVSGRGFAGAQYDWSMSEAKAAQRIAVLTRAGLSPALACKLARGDAGAIDALLHALAPNLWRLVWQHAPEHVPRGTGIEVESTD